MNTIRPPKRSRTSWLNDDSLSGLPTEVLEEILRLEDPLVKIEKHTHNREITRFQKYYHDPVGFVHKGLGEHLWSKQRDIAASVSHNRYTAVQSSHDTGKSFIAARLACWWLSSSPPGDAFVVSTAPTFDQVRSILWREIGRAHAKGHLPGRTNQTEWLMGNELVGMGRKPADYSETAFQGIHARRLLLILDEACGIPESLYDAADSLVTNDPSRMLAIGNPDDPLSHFKKVCSPGSGWNLIKISAFDSPNFTDEPIPDELRELLVSPVWVEERRKRWGEGSPLWQSKVLGEFPEISDDTLIPIGWITAARDRKLEPDYQIELGVDVARFGSDESVIMLRRGPVVKIVETARKRDLMHLTGMIINSIRETRALRVKVDDVGLGGGLVDRLREVLAEKGINVELLPINVGNAPTRLKLAEKFYNLKAQLYWQLRGAFETGEIDIPNDDELIAQLSSIKYSVDSRGRLRVEEKSEMKSRGLPSPDRADALMLCWANVHKPKRLAERARPSPPSVPIYLR